MGIGDELIASGQARELYEKTGQKVVIYDRFGRIRTHIMWANNPHIVTRSDRIGSKPPTLKNGPGLRPYIRDKTEERWTWNEWQCPVGEIFLSPEEVIFAERQPKPVVIIEPNNKAKASPNKDWGRPRWNALVGLLRGAGLEPCQLGPEGTQLLQGVRFIETPTFRHACAVLRRARAAVLPEGGMHHAAAALKVPSVVIFGGYISPAQTGYSTQTNLFTGGAACGMRIPCTHCAEAMARITPQVALEAVVGLLK